jgi:predicted DsbA family dithiol-disulfide isomerase
MKHFLLALMAISFSWNACAQKPSSTKTKTMTESTPKIRIDIWSDVVCPFCLIGKAKLEQSIARLHAQDRFEIVWHSYQLDPEFPVGSAMPSAQYLQERKGISEGDMQGMFQYISESGKNYGIDFRFNQSLSYNTRDVHRVWQWTQTQGKASAFKQAIMKAPFTDGIDLSTRENIVAITNSLQLDAREVENILNNKNLYATEVDRDLKQAETLRIQGVPYFLINGKHVISGAQPDALFDQTLQTALAH